MDIIKTVNPQEQKVYKAYFIEFERFSPHSNEWYRLGTPYYSADVAEFHAQSQADYLERTTRVVLDITTLWPPFRIWLLSKLFKKYRVFYT